MTTKSPTEAALDASGWLTRLREASVTDADTAAFADWLRESPANVREYLEALVIWEQLGEVRPDIDVDALLAKSNVVSLADSGSSVDGGHPKPRRRRRWTTVAAVLAIVTISAATWWSMQTAVDNSPLVTTALGEQRSVALEDGSVIHLNTQSSVRVAIDETRRHVALVDGEAFFDVAKDPDRPFTVEVGDTVIRVVGTRFNVRRLDDTATVTVVEGEVRVSQSTNSQRENDTELTLSQKDVATPLTLVPGQQATVGKGAAPAEPVDVKVEKVVAWTERRLIFEGDTLRDIVTEFNRYNLQRLVLEDESLGNKRLTGVFGANDTESFIAILAETQNITVIERPDGARALVVQNNAGQ